jgi:hypothetical protein
VREKEREREREREREHQINQRTEGGSGFLKTLREEH